MSKDKIKKIIIYKIGSPKIFVYLIIWLMLLVFFGTIAQRDSGLYLVQLDYFSSWIKWFGFLPTLLGSRHNLLLHRADNLCP